MTFLEDKENGDLKHMFYALHLWVRGGVDMEVF